MASPLAGVRAVAPRQSLPTAHTHDPTTVFAKERSGESLAA
jgi:hypothetical protein